ncbi:MAG: hypothetical protein L0Y44_04890 [Phycisphaerales bacterium]|nr:hypothetical protein [Phycisphaerales bacterium]
MDAQSDVLGPFAGLLVDSNVLLLLVIGRVDRAGITRFKRTAQYSRADFDRLVRFLNRFKKIVTTPNVLTEVNGFLSQFKLRSRQLAYAVFGRIIDEVLDERYLPSGTVAKDSAFSWLGLTDTGIGLIAAQRVLVLTEDAELRDALSRRNLLTINFEYLRKTWR